jgi:hypothetical protein
METLILACVKCRLEVVAGRSLEIDPLLAKAFNAVGGCYTLSRQAALIVWYVTTLPSLAVSESFVPGYEI